MYVCACFMATSFDLALLICINNWHTYIHTYTYVAVVKVLQKEEASAAAIVVNHSTAISLFAGVAVIPQRIERTTNRCSSFAAANKQNQQKKNGVKNNTFSQKIAHFVGWLSFALLLLPEQQHTYYIHTYAHTCMNAQWYVASLSASRQLNALWLCLGRRLFHFWWYFQWLLGMDWLLFCTDLLYLCTTSRSHCTAASSAFFFSCWHSDFHLLFMACFMPLPVVAFMHICLFVCFFVCLHYCNCNKHDLQVLSAHKRHVRLHSLYLHVRMCIQICMHMYVHMYL